MNTVSKTSSLQAYSLLLIKKAVHPEFFGIESRRRIEHGDYDVEAWIFRGGHVVRFQQHAQPGAGGRRGAETNGRSRGGSPLVSPSAAGVVTSSRSVKSANRGESAPARGVAGAGSGVGSGLGNGGAVGAPLGAATGALAGGGSAAGSTVGSTAGSAVGSDGSVAAASATCVCEIVTDQPEQIPDRGMLSSFPCAGERDHEEKIAEGLLYMTTIQTETLSEHLYVGTYKEMMQHGREANSLVSAWTDESGRPNLSLLDVQRYRNEVHVQAYHLRSDCGLVLRTQSMFQVDARPVR